MAIQELFRVTVGEESQRILGIDVLFEIQTRTEMDDDFERDFIKATDKSYNAQTDGYNGVIFADFTSKEDAQEAEKLMQALWNDYEDKVITTLKEEQEEFEQDEDA